MNGRGGFNGALQAGLQRFNQHLQPVIEGKLLRVLFGDLAAAFARARPQDLPQKQRTIALLQRIKFGKGLRHGKQFGVAGVNSGHQRINGVIQKFLAQPPQDKLRNGFFQAGRRPPDERLGQNPQLGRERKQGRRQKTGRGIGWPPACCRAPRSAFSADGLE